ncbi:MAG TPA: histidine kinase [Parafilimonas sp.]|nr:histidine kinase [Parafilimonas sp.]
MENQNGLFVLIIICILLPFNLKAQEGRREHIDSLLKVLPFLKEDTGRLQLLNDLAFSYFSINPDSGLYRANQAITLAKKISYPKGLAAAYRSAGANYWEKNEFLRSQDFYWQSLKLTVQVNDTFGMAKSLHGIATNYDALYDYPKALEYYHKAFTAFEKIQYVDGELGCLANIAGAYEMKKAYDSAIVYFQKSLDICKKSSKPRDVAYVSGKIGYMHAKKENYSLALMMEGQSLQWFQSSGYNTNIATTLSEIGEIYLLQKQFENALEYYQRSIAVSGKVQGNYFARFKAKNMVIAGSIYLQMAHRSRDKRQLHLQKAVHSLKTAIDTCLKENEPGGLRDAYKALSEAQALQGDYAASLGNYQQYILYKDSLANAANDKIAMQHELEYIYSRQKDSLHYITRLQQSELHKLSQEQQLASLQLKEHWLYSVVAFAFISLASLFFFFRYRTKQLLLKTELIKEKTEKQLKQTEHQRRLNDLTFSSLRSQMNPHFIFNALNTIQSYVYMNDKKSAASYLGKFSELMRKILDNSSKQAIALDEEIHLLRLYIDIEKARFGDNLIVQIKVQENLDTEALVVPPMLIQPYVENAIKHGLLHKPGEKKLDITISARNGEGLEIAIEDNGIGRTKSMELNKTKLNHHSFATRANEQRIHLLNDQFGKKASVKIIDIKNANDAPTGTKVILLLPLMSQMIS